MQPSESNPVPKPDRPDGRLLIRSKSAKPLSGPQKRFNERVKKVERLRLQLARERATLDQDLITYHQSLAPLLDEFADLRIRVIKSLSGFLGPKAGLTKSQQRTLRDLLRSQLQQIDPKAVSADPVLEKLYGQVASESFDAAHQREFEATRDIMEKLLRRTGVKADLSKFRHDMTPEERAREEARLFDEFEAEVAKAQAQDATRTKGKREIQREERERKKEELRDKSLGTIYRQLAKALHPDLERDPEQKRAKESLMKELTAAYKNDDLHTLLRLELDWIHREEKRSAALSGETLKIYNELLLEQIEELQEELFELPYEPKYLCLADYRPPQNANPRWAREAEEDLKATIEQIRTSLKNLAGPRPLVEVKEALTTWRRTASIEFIPI